MSRGVEIVVRVGLMVGVLIAGWGACGVAALPVAHGGGVRQDDEVRDLAEMLEPIRAKHKLPALAAALVRDGKVVAIGATGVRKAGDEERVTIDDKFHLGSDTKAMTATLIGALVEEGTMRWTTTVGEVFGASVEGMDPAWGKVTVAHLLQNRGGVPADLRADGLWAKLWKREGTPTEQRMRLVEGVIVKPPESEPGSAFVYSNAGYAIAGAMAERMTGKAWEELMQERVFRPLGIDSAGFGAPGSAEKVDEPWGHRPPGTPVAPGPQADNPPAIGPAGTVHMTMGDWGRFVAAHVRGHAANPKREAKLLKAETYEKLHEPAGEYAMGWMVASRGWAKGDGEGARGVVLSHAGSNTMWFCVVWAAPERDFAVLVATNEAGPGASKGADEAVGAVIRLVDEKAR